MKKFTLLFTLTLTVSSIAYSAPVTCTINDLADAQSCMEKVAKARDSYEYPNEGLAAEGALGGELVAALHAADYTPTKSLMEELRNADFIGAVVIQGDENEIAYYALKKGRNKIKDDTYMMNVVDISVAGTPVGSRPSADIFLLNLEAGKAISNVYDDIASRLQE
jgi:hypothetical protein